ncbi:hypothetical protein KIPB_008254 [Kipferlia bialata]|uniref:ATP-grasp domain-containing protein n=1 Tax=Kipferlia bialata TaxID=797122 RepID=A0A9K3D340_9EUKA|nr:hypothetical protein KIPB_008254 [Kipferlia bialata]|eukprot:g8254.t1
MMPQIDNPLGFLLNPKSVAVVGASNGVGKVGYSVMNNIVQSGYSGRVFPINPKSPEVFGFPAFKSVVDVPEDVELVVVCVPARFVVGTMKQCAEKKVRGVVIITAGFKEVSEEGAELEKQIQAIAKEANIRVVGPNCLGVITPFLNASFASRHPKRGHIAMVSQSGAMMTAVLDWAATCNVGFSNFVSIGNKADVDEVDLIDLLADDPETNIILLYLESVEDGEKFLKVVSKATSKKPVIILKSGTSNAGAAAAASHTGALAGSDTSFTLAFERSGVIRATTMNDLFDMARIFDQAVVPKGENFAIITNAGGPGIVATDAFENNGLGLTHFTPSIEKELIANLPAEAATHNPVDIIGDAPPARYKTALEIAFKDDIDVCAGALVLVTPQSQTEPAEVARMLVDVQEKYPERMIVGCFMGGISMTEPAEILAGTTVPMYQFPEPAINSIKYACAYNKIKAAVPLHEQVMPTISYDKEAVTAVFDSVKAEDRKILLAYETAAIFTALGVDCPGTKLAKSPKEAGEKAAEIGFPVVMKIVSPEIMHKSDCGGVVLFVKSAEQAEGVYTQIMEACAERGPKGANLVGVEIQEMVDFKAKAKNSEIILGINKDAQWGHMVMFGQGGIYANYTEDVSFQLAHKYTAELARAQLKQTKINTILEGVRGEPRSDIDSVVDVMTRLAQLVNDFPEITELDMNPLLVFAEGEGYSAVDVKITIE